MQTKDLITKRIHKPGASWRSHDGSVDDTAKILWSVRSRQSNQRMIMIHTAFSSSTRFPSKNQDSQSGRGTRLSFVIAQAVYSRSWLGSIADTGQRVYVYNYDCFFQWVMKSQTRKDKALWPWGRFLVVLYDPNEALGPSIHTQRGFSSVPTFALLAVWIR